MMELQVVKRKKQSEKPIYYWLPSIAHSGMTFVTSDIRLERTFVSGIIEISIQD
jgi:hypothetical protein